MRATNNALESGIIRLYNRVNIVVRSLFGMLTLCDFDANENDNSNIRLHLGHTTINKTRVSRVKSQPQHPYGHEQAPLCDRIVWL